MANKTLKLSGNMRVIDIDKDGDCKVENTISVTWIKGRPSDEASYLVKNAMGEVAPMVRGIISNNVGTENDWTFGQIVTAYIPLTDFFSA